LNDPKEVGAALGCRDHVLFAKVRLDPFLLAPDAASIRPVSGHPTLVEQLDPSRAASVPQGVHVVVDFKKLSALGAVVDYLVERVGSVTTRDATK
jgi:hypothetical protein